MTTRISTQSVGVKINNVAFETTARKKKRIHSAVIAIFVARSKPFLKHCSANLKHINITEESHLGKRCRSFPRQRLSRKSMSNIPKPLFPTALRHINQVLCSPSVFASAILRDLNNSQYHTVIIIILLPSSVHGMVNRSIFIHANRTIQNTLSFNPMRSSMSRTLSILLHDALNARHDTLIGSSNDRR